MGMKVLVWRATLSLSFILLVVHSVWPAWERFYKLSDGRFALEPVDCGINTEYAVVTFVHSDENHIDSANRLALSLDQYGANINRVAMVVETVDGLKGWKQCTFEEVKNNVKRIEPNWDKIVTKLEVLRMQGKISRLVYVDADSLAGPRFSELFDLDAEKDAIAAPKAYQDFEYQKYLNAGVMVLKPSFELFHLVVDLERINKTSNDQHLLWNAINYGRIKWKPLDKGLVVSRAEVSLYEGHPYAVCHWAGFDKPWTGCVGKNDFMCTAWNGFGAAV